MKETIMTIIVMLNAICAVWNYRKKDYDLAMLNSFLCGAGITSLLTL